MKGASGSSQITGTGSPACCLDLVFLGKEGGLGGLTEPPSVLPTVGLERRLSKISSPHAAASGPLVEVNWGSELSFTLTKLCYVTNMTSFHYLYFLKNVFDEFYEGQKILYRCLS